MNIYVENGAYVPERAHKTDAGLDIFSCDAKYVSSIHEDLQELTKTLYAINDNLLCIQDNLCASNIMHDYKQSFDDIQVLLTTVDKDKLHTLANSLKKEDQNYDD